MNSTAMTTEAGPVERLQVDHGATKHLGHWTSASRSEVRVRRGGIAILSAMFSRAYVQDVRQARKNGTYPTVDDPARAIRRPDGECRAPAGSAAKSHDRRGARGCSPARPYLSRLNLG